MNIASCTNFINRLKELSPQNHLYLIGRKNTLSTLSTTKTALLCLETLATSNLEPSQKKNLLHAFSASFNAYKNTIVKPSSIWSKIVRLFGLILGTRRKIEHELTHLSSLSHHVATFFSKSAIMKESLSNDKKMTLLFDAAQAFEVTHQMYSPVVRQQIDMLPPDKRCALLYEMSQKYTDFLRWMRATPSQKTLSPQLKLALLREKTKICSEVYRNYANFVYAVTQSYSEILQKKIDCSQLHLAPNDGTPPSEQHPCTVILPEGLMLLSSLFAKKLPSFCPTVCESYQEFEKKLLDLHNDGSFYFLVRCQNASGPPHPHHSAVYIEKKKDRVIAFFSDSTSGNNNHFVTNLSSLIHQAIPTATLYSSSFGRQKDLFNCSVFALKDLKAIHKDQARDLLSMCRNSSTHMLPVRCIKAFPLPMMKTVQSTTSFDQQMAVAKFCEKTAKLQKLRDSFTLIDGNTDKEIYCYTKFYGLKYRLQIIADAFSKAFCL
jgi:hypothetical protein